MGLSTICWLLLFVASATGTSTDVALVLVLVDVVAPDLQLLFQSLLGLLLLLLSLLCGTPLLALGVVFEAVPIVAAVAIAVIVAAVVVAVVVAIAATLAAVAATTRATTANTTTAETTTINNNCCRCRSCSSRFLKT